MNGGLTWGNPASLVIAAWGRPLPARGLPKDGICAAHTFRGNRGSEQRQEKAETEVKDNNMMVWALAAAAAWFLWKQGTLDPYIGGFSDLFPGDEVVVNGNGDGGGNGNGNGNGATNGVSGISDWGNIYA